MDRISMYEALAKRNEIDPFLKRMVTGDEKWVTYDNTVRKRSWSKRGEAAQTGVKLGLTPKKVLIYLSTTGPFEARDWLERSELANRRGVVFHQDKARLHTSVVTRQKLLEFGWKVLMHPPYSPDMAPRDYARLR
ncbi:histone-lysine N-methyltransferase SETMAR [Trichonephila clavipes]|nr:histone-lysine N-methyltransferase SETMAR [Trichonephila clavipes]